MTALQDRSRVHALDGLRAAMMLLGLVLHAAASYTSTPLGATWPYQDDSTNVVFDFVVFIIHLFRMPTFFVIAGFFAALLYYRSGPRGLLTNRVRRVLVPLVLAWVVMVPLVTLGFLYAVSRGGVAGGVTAASVASTGLYRATLMHLWFLYDLFIFYLVALAVMAVVERMPMTLRERVVEVFGSMVHRWWAPFVCAVVSFATLLPMQVAALDSDFSFTPPVRVLAAYLAFFTFGWLLFLNRQAVPTFARHPWLMTASGLTVSLAYMATVLSPLVATPQGFFIGRALAAAAMWLLIYATIGLFVRYFDAHRPLQRYVSDGAYWIYIVHLPVVITASGFLAPFDWPAVLKFALAVGTTTVVTVVTYHFLVRSTLIGALLNGRRYPRALPVHSGTAAAVHTRTSQLS
jgi:glucan biosynthesis protein C